MANKRIYSIEINGIAESVKQTDLLLEKINNLNDKLKDISKDKIKITLGGKETQKEVETTENTVASLRKELSALKKQWANTDINSDGFKELSKKVLDATNKVKKLESATGDFRRNVGNYTNSIVSAFQKFPQEVQNNINSLKSFNGNVDTLNGQVRMLKKAMEELAASGGANSEEMKALEEVYSNVAYQAQTLNERLNEVTDNTAGFTLMIDSLSQIANIMQVATAASQLFGKSNEDVAKGIAKLQQIMAIASGLEKLKQAFQTNGVAIRLWNSSLGVSDKILKMLKVSTLAEAQAQGTLSTATIVSANAMKTLRTAIASTGIGALVVLIGSLVGWLMSLGDETEDVKESFEDLNKTTEILIQGLNVKKELGLINSLDAARQKVKLLQNQLSKTNDEIEELIKKELSGWVDAYDGVTDRLGSRLKGLLYSSSILVNDALSAQKYIQLFNDALLDLKVDEASDGWIAIAEQRIEELEKLRDAYIEVEKEQNNFFEGIKDMNIQSMEDGYDKQLAIIEENYRKQQEKYVGNQEALLAAKKLYEKQVADLDEEWAKKRQNIEMQISANELASHKRNLSIRLRQLELERQREIQVARDSKIEVERQIGAINAKYNKMRNDEIEKSRTAFEKTLQQSITATEKMTNEYERIVRSWEEITTHFYDEQVNGHGKLSEIFKEVFDLDNANLGEGFDVLQSGKFSEYFREEDKVVRQMLLEWNSALQIYYDGRAQETRDYYENEKKVLNTYYDESLLLLATELENEKKEREKSIKDSEYTESQKYDLLQQLNDEFAAKVALETEKIEQQRVKAVKEANEQIEKTYEQNISNTINYIKRADAVLKSQMNNTNYTNSFGLFNLKQANDDAKEYVRTYTNLKQQLENQLIDLNKKFKDGLINSDTFIKTKEELMQLIQDYDNSIKDINNKSKNNVSEFISSINTYASEIGNTINGMISAFGDLTNYEIEKEIDTLEKEMEQLEKMYDKQEELAKKHTDNIKSIEDELQTARGDRRDQLIAAYAAENQAKEEAYKKEQEIAKQKERNERKQEALSKQQKKAEYKRNVAQSIVSASLAVLNALATQPFIPVGVAMGALATSLGAVQIATIAKQKPYANGGLLDGASHANGGIPIPELGAEVEGGEFVTNKKTTSDNLPLLQYINEQKHKIGAEEMANFFANGFNKMNVSKSRFANGGELPQMQAQNTLQSSREIVVTDNRPVIVSVEEINRVNSNVRNVQTLAGI